MPIVTTEVFNTNYSDLIAGDVPPLMTEARLASTAAGATISGIVPKYTILTAQTDGSFDIWSGTGRTDAILLLDADLNLSPNLQVLSQGCVWAQKLVYDTATITIDQLKYAFGRSNIVVLDQTVNNT